MKNVNKKEVKDDITILRLYTPEHKNKFILQFSCYCFFFIQVLYYGIKYSKNYDVVFSTSSRLGTGFLGYVLAKIFKKKYALDIRDIFSDSLRSLKFSRSILGSLVISFFEKIESMICWNADWLNFVSPGFLTYDHIKRDKKDINFFTNGIDQIFIKSMTNKTTPFKDPLIITYAGNIGYGQGLEKTIIYIARHFKDKIFFQLVGDGSSVTLIKDKIRRSKVQNIKIIKPVKRNLLLKIYNESDVLFLQLNNIKAFENVLPSKIFDYGSYNKPILAGVGGIAKDFIQNNLDCAYIYEPGNYKQGIQRVNEILNNGRIKINNEKFIKMYSRERIMRGMTNSIYKKLS